MLTAARVYAIPDLRYSMICECGNYSGTTDILLGLIMYCVCVCVCCLWFVVPVSYVQVSKTVALMVAK